MASAIVPAIYDPALADEALELPTEEAYRMVKRLARETGLLVGHLRRRQRGGRPEGRPPGCASGTLVTVLCDGADKYLTDRFWEEESSGERMSRLRHHPRGPARRSAAMARRPSRRSAAAS